MTRTNMTITAAVERPPAFLRIALLIGAALGFGFALAALLFYPASALQTALYVVALGLTALCAAVIWLGLRPTRAKGQPIIWRLSMGFGLLNGGLWIVEILVANLIAVNTSTGMVVYRAATFAAFAMPLLAGGVGAYRLRRISGGIVIGFWSGLISGLLAFLTLMGIAYAFMPALQHDAQTLREFAHSGERTLSTYIVGDFLFGSCAHLLFIGVLYGTGVAAIGALVGKALGTSAARSLNNEGA